MTLRINDTAPDFTANSAHGEIRFHDRIGEGHAVLFGHPEDFTPVCTTEPGYMVGLEDAFAMRNTRMIGISVDPVESHEKWKADIRTATGNEVDDPLIGDPQLTLAKLHDMLPAEARDTCEGRTPSDNATVRSVCMVGPDRKVKLTPTGPMTTGRNFDAILRTLDSIRLTAGHMVATPVQWQQGDDVIITAAVFDEESMENFGGVERVMPYLRKISQPGA